jgi:hypothetical protein
MPRAARHHPGRVRPLVGAQGWVRVDGRPICEVCGQGVQLTGPDRWRHVPNGRRYTGRSRWLAPVTFDALRSLQSYAEFGDRYPWAVRPDFGGPFVTSEEHWREGVRRLTQYHAALEEFRRHPALGPGENPYADLVGLLSAPLRDRPGPERCWGLPPGLYQMMHASGRRRELAELFAWAIPSEDALGVLARYAPLVECGAGTGYWTGLLRLRGVDAVAYDLVPPGAGTANGFHGRAGKPWTGVARGTSVAAVRRHRDRTLFLCWPPHGDDDASYEPLRAYRGDALIYVGEPGEGVTGSLRFQRELALNWTLVEQVELPRWPWLRDRVMVFRRNPVRRPLRQRDRCYECKRYLPTGSIGRCDRCFERRPPAVALTVGHHRVEYPATYLESLPPAVRIALEASPNRIV